MTGPSILGPSLFPSTGAPGEVIAFTGRVILGSTPGVGRITVTVEDASGSSTEQKLYSIVIPTVKQPASVTIGTRSRTLSGVDVPRGAEQLIAYGPTAMETGTNQWGTEVTIRHGAVTAINNRQATGSKTSTTIPVDGCVLSGHDTAADWLLDAKVGDTVVFRDAAGSVTPWPANALSTPATDPPPVTVPPVPPIPPVPTTTPWQSGVSGVGAVDGTFGTWRGKPVKIIGTWSDNSTDNEANFYQFQPGGEYAAWAGSADVAIGGPIGVSWAQAATGALDAHWTTQMTNLSRLWGGVPRRGVCYIRFAHEYNGDWMDWQVRGSEVADFKRAWVRFRGIQRTLFPTAKLVLSPSGSNHQGYGLGGLIGNVAATFPDRSTFDVLAPDIYADTWIANLNVLTDWAALAASVGKPLALGEWGGKVPTTTDAQSARFVRAVNDLGKSGGLLYDLYFNIDYTSDHFAVYPKTGQLAATSDAYRALTWGS